MPYSIISIADFETAIGVAGVVGLAEFWSRKFADAERRSWGFHSYCFTDFNDELVALPELFRDEYDAMFSNLIS